RQHGHRRDNHHLRRPAGGRPLHRRQRQLHHHLPRRGRQRRGAEVPEHLDDDRRRGDRAAGHRGLGGDVYRPAGRSPPPRPASPAVPCRCWPPGTPARRCGPSTPALTRPTSPTTTAPPAPTPSPSAGPTATASSAAIAASSPFSSAGTGRGTTTPTTIDGLIG